MNGQQIANAAQRAMAQHEKLQTDFIAYALSIGCHPLEFDRIGPATPEQEKLLAAWWTERTGMPVIKSDGTIL